MLQRDGSGKVVAPADELSCAGTVRVGGRTGRYDSFVAPGGFTLVVQDGFALPAGASQLCRELGVRVVTIADRRSATDTQIGDTQGQFGRFMATRGLRAMLVRPDFYLFGGAADGSRLITLLEDFAHEMHSYGVEPARTAALA